MPVYNAEKTIRSSIESVINQTFGFENIEFIIVDDNSRDNSRKIIEEYSDKHDNIKPIYRKENSRGPSIPRNSGIGEATGEYMMFLDSDDEFMPDYCETMYDALSDEKEDIVHCNNYSKFLDGLYAPSNVFSKEKVFGSEHVARHTLWGNLFKSSFIKGNDIKCPDTLCEDGLFCIRAFTEGDNVVVLPNYYGYIYVVESEENDSITHNIDKDYIFRFFDGLFLMNEYFDEKGLDKQRIINLIKIVFFMFFKLKDSKKNKLAVLERLYEFEMAINQPIVVNFKPFDLLNKLILKRHFSLFIFISNILGDVYNNRTIKNIIFKKYSNFEKVDNDSFPVYD